MSDLEYLEYSAKEPMALLRKKFNNGADIFKTSPTTLTAEDASADVKYLKYVFENAYSGFSYYDKPLFDTAFASIVKSLKNSAQITPDQLIDVICSNLSFISDGHLALTTADYGNGFYKELQTYVSDMLVYKVRDAYYDAKTKKQVLFDDTVRAFPTLNNSIADSYLIGIRSKNPTEKISVKLDGKDEILPLHRIMSKEQTEESLVEERYEENIAIITCSSFVGDSEEAMKKLYEVGKKCRKYRHVVWDLSNNLGGNSEFPKHFLKGLYGDVADTVKVLELCDNGYEVLSYKKKYHYYYVVNRSLETAEVVMLADVINASKLPVAQKKALVGRLAETLCTHQAESISKHIISLDKYYARDIRGTWYETSDRSNLAKVISESECLFGYHPVYDINTLLSFVRQTDTG